MGARGKMADLKDPVICDECGSTNITKAGTRKTKTWGTIRKFQCADCGHYMSNSPGVWVNTYITNRLHEYTIVEV